ncbi:ADR287Cp [Eremothecium gossypii ATCC 10895]|uniref:RNA helicase n=1 Tax=Eremothecium gossypii (strain ATCC 10895 / CBS 109.51 / FGSC 9923 / NRRL Y-1056) TaxID=284811 RepID=Q759J0_EREGS|nr:ADR287Cp [Eremothecium gossypii ATCC 10895]AAS52207.1 ADR287Cp [Eremothecium gossypii ATCC 10895]
MSDPDVVGGTGKRRIKRKFDEDIEQDIRAPTAEVRNTGSEHGAGATEEIYGTTDSAQMQELRRLARQRYLDRREREKLDWAIRDLALLEEDVKKYGWDKLTERERREIGTKRQLVQIVRERDAAAAAAERRFHMPGETVVEATARQEKSWEEQQVQKAVRAEGRSDIIEVEGSEQYEFVLDSRSVVRFTEEETLAPGERVEKQLEQKLEKEIKRVASIQETRRQLPVYAYRDELLKAVRDHQVLIVVGETGSGKTTQLPQYLVEDGYTQDGKLLIACTQPRRVAATSVASRVADEMGVLLGREVGYQIRFDDRTTADVTLLKYMTDGMLLREFLADPELSRYSCIMIDEAHERTLATDILLGLLKDVLLQRKDLKLLISSATMNASRFSEFFYNAPIFNVPGRRYPVDIHYTLQPEANYVHAAISTIFQVHTSQPLPGDILVFLTGQDEIETVREKVEEIAFKLGKNIKPMIINPIYANLPQEQQSRIFEPTPKNARKVVLATNIAETSLTIEGIKYVIDPGFVKENSYMPQTGMTQLLTVPCSKASVDQRAGRAGRVGPGKCYRLFTKWSYHNELESLPKPEILRTSLSQVVLLLLSLGVTDLLKFPMLDKPSIANLSRSLEQLYVLGALNSKGTITKLGRMMCEFPCAPEFGKVLHSSAADDRCAGVLEDVVTIVAMLHETASIFAPGKERKKVLGPQSSDHMLYLEIYNAWAAEDFRKGWCHDHHVQFRTLSRVRSIREQLWRCCDKLGLVALNALFRKDHPHLAAQRDQRVAKAFLSGFPFNVAQLTPNGYRTMGKHGGMTIHIHPTSLLYTHNRESGKPPKHLLYQQLMLTSKEFMRDCLPIPRETWLKEMVPQLFGALP